MVPVMVAARWYSSGFQCEVRIQFQPFRIPVLIRVRVPVLVPVRVPFLVPVIVPASGRVPCRVPVLVPVAVRVPVCVLAWLLLPWDGCVVRCHNLERL